MKIKAIFLWVLIIVTSTSVEAENSCGQQGVWFQILGSGGPALEHNRASSSYLIWYNGQARILIDMGAGSLLRFKQAGAQINDLDVILLSHLHVDHSNDLPAYIKASYFSGRDRDLLLYGPTGNYLMPATTTYVQNLLGTQGAFRYLSDYLDGRETYRLLPHDVNAREKTQQLLVENEQYQLTAVAVHHGPIPALAWRIDIAGYSIVLSGDMNNDNQVLTKLAEDADLLLAHQAIPERSGGVARRLHMPPSVIGQIAAKARVKKLVLSHRMNRTLGKESTSAEFIRQSFSGTLTFADDLQCIKLESRE